MKFLMVLIGLFLLATAAFAQYPSSVLDLSYWKLTLPIDEDGNGKADEIKQPELATYEHPVYFHVNSDGTGVVFRAHCGGATTSGSGYPRSELREMQQGDATQKASWSTDDGVKHVMEITQAITHLPDVKPHVVAGQIHDANDDVIVFRLEGSKLFIDINGTDGPTLNSNYQLGEVFKVKFEVYNGVIDCYYNDQLKYSYTHSASGCYFKAGCYTQSNTSKGDDASAYGEVVIYDLLVTHGDQQPPTVSLTSPADGSTFTEGETITLQASASDADGSISRVEFYANGNKLGEDSSAPYSYDWSGATAGTYDLYARAFDNDG
ncbi:hypothetical protein D6833_05360, partial [Candidatus Parcubacteria bacterium]